MSLTTFDGLLNDMYPLSGERIKQWVVDERRIRAREVETYPHVDVPPHDDNTGVPCGDVGRSLWIDIFDHHCCRTCSDLAQSTADRPDIAAWLSDRATWPEPCTDRSVLSDEIAPDLALVTNPWAPPKGRRYQP